MQAGKARQSNLPRTAFPHDNGVEPGIGTGGWRTAKVVVWAEAVVVVQALGRIRRNGRLD